MSASYPTPSPEGYDFSPFEHISTADLGSGQSTSEEKVIELIKEDLKAGWDINALDQYGGTMLMDAADRRLPLIAEFLIEEGTDITVRDPEYNRSALHWAAKAGLSGIVETLVKQGLPTDEADNKGFTPLLIALSQAYEAHLINPKETDVTTGKKVKKSKWVKSVIDGWQGYINTVIFLIDRGADVNTAEKKSGHTALHYVADKGYPEMIELLIKKGADPSKKATSGGLTPLHFAARHGFTNIVEPLILAGADVDVQDEFGFTPLHEAVLAHEVDVVKLLLEQGADPLVKVTKGYKPYTNKENAIDMATDKEFTDILELVQPDKE